MGKLETNPRTFDLRLSCLRDCCVSVSRHRYFCASRFRRANTTSQSSKTTQTSLRFAQYKQYVHMYIYIYRKRERQKEKWRDICRCTYMYVYTYTYIYIYIYVYVHTYVCVVEFLCDLYLSSYICVSPFLSINTML